MRKICNMCDYIGSERVLPFSPASDVPDVAFKQEKDGR